MIYAILCDPGLELECIREIHHHFALKAVQGGSGCVLIDAKTHTSLSAGQLAYKLQSAHRILTHVVHAQSNDSITDEQLQKFVDGIRSTSVKSFHVRALSYQSSSVLEAQMGGRLKTFLQIPVSFEKQSLCVYAYEMGDICLIGADQYGDLTKREYRIFMNAQALKSTVYYSMVNFSDYDPKKHLLLDPFCTNGGILIEAALAGLNKSCRHYEKEKYGISLDMEHESTSETIKGIYGFDILPKFVDFTKKNAKIAGVLKFIHVARCEADWLDLKLHEPLDRIVSAIPFFSKEHDERIERYLKQFQHRIVEFVTKKTLLVFATNDEKKLLTILSYYERIESKPFFMGGMQLFLVKMRMKPTNKKGKLKVASE